MSTPIDQLRTTDEWWLEVSSCPTRMIAWLKSQYYGEATAVDRVLFLISHYNVTGKNKLLLQKISDDERNHARWVKGLLLNRGIEGELLTREERYWAAALVTGLPETFELAAAIGHHAEVMRLDRIQLLAADKRFEDIAEVFTKILKDELFHAKALGLMSTPEAIEQTRHMHIAGANALGLVA